MTTIPGLACRTILVPFRVALRAERPRTWTVRWRFVARSAKMNFTNTLNRYIGTLRQGYVMDLIQIARICHAANAEYCRTIGDFSQTNWDNAAPWQRESAVKGVEFALAGGRSPADQHASWLAEKREQGWRWGPVKDAEIKTHPCMVEYGELPPEQRQKDHIFLAIVEAFRQGSG